MKRNILEFQIERIETLENLSCLAATKSDQNIERLKHQYIRVGIDLISKCSFMRLESDEICEI